MPVAQPQRAEGRRLWTALLLCVTIQLMLPAPAHALWEWVDNLSGPGPFKGEQFDFTIVCFASPPQWADAATATVTAYSIVRARGLRVEKVDIEQGAMIDYWVARFAKARPRTKEEMLAAANDVTTVLEQVPAVEQEARDALTRAASLWRGATQPTVGSFPGGVVWTSCRDNPKNSPVLSGAVMRKDRRPAPSIVINYRQTYANWSGGLDTPFAPGYRIALHAIEPKLSWPLSGSRDFVDGQAGIGRYWISSDAFPTLTGWIVEPVRVNFHFPASFADGKAFPRILLAFSYSASVVLFPTGFPAGAFGANSPALPGNEAIFEQSVVINVGRLFR